MRVSRITEEQYERQLSLAQTVRNDARTALNSDVRALMTSFADMMESVARAHKLEETPE